MDNKRKHPRITFSVDDGIVARFLVNGGNSDLQTAYVLNLSEGGLFFILRNDQSDLVKEGDDLRFVEIKKWRTAHFLVNIHADVIWFGDMPEHHTVGIGCQFKEISDKNRKNIRDLVGERLGQGMELR